VQLLDVVRDMVAMIRETFPKNILTRTELPCTPWLVEGDATQLHQVLMNLCVNSRDAMPEGGILTLSVENAELDAAAVAGHAGVAPGPFVVLGVTDTGCGIDPEYLDKIFDPFFTTKEVGKGTGARPGTALGLVRATAASSRYAATSGSGTQVRVCLPAAPDCSVLGTGCRARAAPRGQE
jgi:signal transduction histidine kinase